MRIEFNESKYESGFTLYPDTPAEFAQLLRMGRNTAAEPPSVYVSFSNDNPYACVSMRKRKESVQHNSVSPKTK